MPAEIGSLPLCPHCESTQVQRNGFRNEAQRYYCKNCNRGFIGNARQYNHIPMQCHRCGGRKIVNTGRNRGIQRGYCQECRRSFCQGGRRELDLNMRFVLIPRIVALRLAPDLASEVLQHACQDVLQGRGYCATVALKVSESRTVVYGRWKSTRISRYYQMVTEGTGKDA